MNGRNYQGKSINGSRKYIGKKQLVIRSKIIYSKINHFFIPLIKCTYFIRVMKIL